MFSSSFSWFFVFYYYFDEMVSPGSVGSFLFDVGFAAFLVSIGVSAFIGSVIAGRVNRRKLVFYWLIVGVLATLPILVFHGSEYLIVWGVIAGLSFGWGFPSCMSFLADSSTPEERGRVAGLVLLVTFIVAPLALLVKQVLALESVGILLLTIGLKSIGFLSLALDPIDRIENKPKPWRDILRYKDFNLYLLAYVLFMVATSFVSLLWNGLPPDPEYLALTGMVTILHYVGAGVFAIIAGLMADRIGRKKTVIFGLVMLGGAYAMVGLVTNSQTYFVNMLLSGIAWGVINVVFLVVPADLSFAGSTERFYTVGWVLPLLLYTGVTVTGNLIGITLPINVLATILMFVVVAAIIPVLSAVETLSESKMRERKFREYAEKVGKTIQESQEADEK